MDNKNSIEENFTELSLFNINPELAAYLDLDFCTSNHIVLLDDPAIEDLDKIRVGVLNIDDKELLKEASLQNKKRKKEKRKTRREKGT